MANSYGTYTADERLIALKAFTVSRANNPLIKADYLQEALGTIMDTDAADGMLAVAVGAAATPSYAFTGDPDTGMWHPAANEIAWSTGGSERMRIGSDGSVGIGVDPAYLLHVRAANPSATASTSYDDFVIENSGAATGMSILTSNGQGVGLALGSPSDPDAARFHYDTGGATLYLQVASGESALEAVANGAVRLYYDNSVRLATSSGGVVITGGNGNALTVTGSAAASAVMGITNSHASSPYGVNLNFSAASPDDNTYYFLNCADSTTTRLRLYSDGDGQNHDNSWGGISDRRMKANFLPARSYWDDWKRLSYQTFQMIDDISQYGEDTARRFGLVAQDLLEEDLFPSLVRYDEADDRYGLKYSVLNTIGGSVLQEALHEIDSLKAEVAELRKAA